MLLDFMLMPNNEDIDEDDFYDETDEQENSGKVRSFFRQNERKRSASTEKANNMKIEVFRPSDKSECKDIADALLDGHAVIILFTKIDLDASQMMMNFLSGVCYTINGTICNVAELIFVITPKDIDINDTLAACDDLV